MMSVHFVVFVQLGDSSVVRGLAFIAWRVLLFAFCDCVYNSLQCQ